MKLTFDKSASLYILQVFKKSVDSEGFIIDNKTKKRVLDLRKEEIPLNDFIGVIKNPKTKQPIFLKDNIDTIVDLATKVI